MAASESHHAISLVLIDIALIVAVARVLGLGARRIRQPGVVAEIAAGLILGPSLLGLLPGDLDDRLFPDDVRAYLTVIAALGLTIYMFVVGLELDLGLIRGKERMAAVVSVSSISLPFVLGAALAFWLHDRHGTVAGKEVDLLPFALFIGAAMSVTAFPVLARILSERGIQRTRIGSLALACAAVDDVLAWTMLAAVTAVVGSSGGMDLVAMVAESVGFVLVMFLLVRPQLRQLVARRNAAGRLTPDIFAVVLVGVLVCSVITDVIGIHAIFGAFLFGAVMPRRGAEQLSHEILERVEQVTVLLLLPVFFVVTGLQVDVTKLGRGGVLELVAVVTVACVGKFVGAAVAARALGVRSRRAAALGVLMNTRGLTELVVLSVGKAIGVLDQDLFTVMVLMAIITTVMTEPLLRLVYPDRAVARDIVEAEREAMGRTAEHRVLVLVEDDTDPLVVDTAVTLLGSHEDCELLLTRLEQRRTRAVEIGTGLTADMAAVAESLERTQALARRARELGAAVHVSSQLVDDAVAEALVHAEAADAEVVVVSAGSRLAGPLAADGVRVVVEVGRRGDLLAPPGPFAYGRIAAWPGWSEDGIAAVEQAIRAAERLGLPLALVVGESRREQRRGAAIERRLGAAGLTVERGAVDDPAATGVLLLFCGHADASPAGESADAIVLTVRGRGDDEERLDSMLERRTPEAVH